MAKKFKDLHGVLLVETRTDEHGNVLSMRNAHSVLNAKEFEYTIEDYGDKLFMLDKNNNFEIVEILIKGISHDRRGITRITACKMSDSEALKNNELKGLFRFSTRGNRTHSGLFFTNIEEAEKYQKQLRNGVGFALLKSGDKVYLTVDNEIKEEEVVKTFFIDEDYHHYFQIDLKNIGSILFESMAYEERATELLDTGFYTYGLDEKYRWKNVKIFVNKSDAEKSIKDSLSRKQKSATVKYIKDIENHDGKPISFCDKKGKQLHYGDKVAYAVSCGSSAPFISFGIIKSESKTRITVIDEEKDFSNKEIKHLVSPGCLLLVEEAKVNSSSGYSFKKTK